MMRTPKDLAPREEHTTGREHRTLAEAERQVMEAAMAYHHGQPGPERVTLAVELDYACVVLDTARRRVEEANTDADRAYRSYVAVTA